MMYNTRTYECSDCHKRVDRDSYDFVAKICGDCKRAKRALEDEVMEDTNCTVYLDDSKIRGKLNSLGDHGFNVSISAKDYIKLTGKAIGIKCSTVALPGISSGLITLDDSVKIIKQTISDMDLSIDSIITIEHDVSNWQWYDKQER